MPGDATDPPASASGWAPLRRPVFRALWLAQFVANTGTWMQTVGAQWLMGDLGGGALAMALVQAATTLPVFLLVVPAGALGDILDRRRLLLAGQALMCAGAAAITAPPAPRAGGHPGRGGAVAGGAGVVRRGTPRNPPHHRRRPAAPATPTRANRSH